MSSPIGAIQQRNLTVRGGNCNHRKYIPKLVGLVAIGVLDPAAILTNTEPLTGAIEAYETFGPARTQLDQGGARPGRLIAGRKQRFALLLSHPHNRCPFPF